jgi:sulfur relay (sulfurtransferase) DsrC/TusE family protein
MIVNSKWSANLAHKYIYEEMLEILNKFYWSFSIETPLRMFIRNATTRVKSGSDAKQLAKYHRKFCYSSTEIRDSSQKWGISRG